MVSLHIIHYQKNALTEPNTAAVYEEVVSSIYPNFYFKSDRHLQRGEARGSVFSFICFEIELYSLLRSLEEMAQHAESKAENG